MYSKGSEIDGDVGNVGNVSEEVRSKVWAMTSSSTWSIVVGELREWKEFRPVVLLIIAEDVEVLLECLVSAFGLTITFRMISRSEMKSHVKGFSE